MGQELDQLPYSRIIACDFEYIAGDGEQPVPVCMVARDLLSGEIIRLWADELGNHEQAPFDTGPDTLFVAYYAPAELGCFIALDWKLPSRVLDLFTEFRCETNGQNPPYGNGLIGALTYFGLPAIGGEAKEDMRQLIMDGGPWTAHQKLLILDYCQSDVDALARLLPVVVDRWLTSSQRLGQALLRGRYMAAVARMEANGVPIDVSRLGQLRETWQDLRQLLIDKLDTSFRVYDGTTFKRERFEAYLMREEIPWPRLASGALALDDDTFRQQAKTYPQISPLRELRHALSDLKLNKLAVGSDGRNRTMLSPFRSKTGRNQPSNSMSIFGPSVWLRGLIKPRPGYSIAYVDWKSQEIGVAAALSGDKAMWAAYASGDPYMAFAIQAGLAPKEATKATHKEVRDRCKVIVLGVQYGMTPQGLANASGIHIAEARELVLRHKETYRTFWAWAEQNMNAGLLGCPLKTVFGWKIELGFGAAASPNSFLNWPMQSNGAEMMRLACCKATEAGLKICLPVHDALLLEAPTELIDTHVHQLSKIMKHASSLVLGGEKYCGVDVDIVHAPDRYMDGRGRKMWETVTSLLDDLGRES